MDNSQQLDILLDII
jgi:hypothetical protein